jgi:superfamily I DNA and RNA helicase
MDISNYILARLKEIKVSGEIEKVKSLLGCVPEFHYLFLDEVQDLPSGITYMISLLFSNGVYYSGDTAQAIQKGVSFKFQDIVMMYRPEFET